MGKKSTKSKPVKISPGQVPQDWFGPGGNIPAPTPAENAKAASQQIVLNAEEDAKYLIYGLIAVAFVGVIIYGFKG